MLYADQDFAALFPALGQPALPPWRLALVTVVQFLENLTDRQAAAQVRARLDLKYLLGLEFTDPGFDWQEDRERHLRRDLACGEHTRALYVAYREHLGPWRYHLLRQVQGVLVPAHVRALLGLPGRPWLRGLLPLYSLAARLGLRGHLRRALIPPAHLASVQQLDLQFSGGRAW